MWECNHGETGAMDPTSVEAYTIAFVEIAKVTGITAGVIPDELMRRVSAVVDSQCRHMSGG